MDIYCLEVVGLNSPTEFGPLVFNIHKWARQIIRTIYGPTEYGLSSICN